MPAKPSTHKKRRAVVEEIIETPVQTAPVHHAHKVVEETVPEPHLETVHEVASYDEPPMEEGKPAPHAHPETAARELLQELDTGKDRRSNMKVIFLVTILTALIVGFIAGGVYVYVTGVNSSQGDVVVKVSPSPSPEVTSTPTPSAAPVVKLDSLSVNVLNGSGVIGAANKVKAALESGGFKVAGTGNAANYNFQKTMIQVKATTPKEVVDAAKNALSGYSVEVGDTLPDSSKFDMVVTAGKE